MELILVHGGNPKSYDIAMAAGWRYGVRSDYTSAGPVHMFDWNWKRHSTPRRWRLYLEAIAKHKPYMAMAPDFENPRQWQTLKQQIIEIKRAGAQHVIVTPKFHGALDLVPRWRTFIVGVSVPTEYAGFLPRLEDINNRALHFLGGAPDQWIYLRRVYEDAGAMVVSCDGNFAMREARRGKYWSAATGGYNDLRGEMFDSEALALASLRNVNQYIQCPPPQSSLVGRERVRKCIKMLGLRDTALPMGA